MLDKGKIIFDGDVEDAIGVYAKGNMLALQSDYDVSKIKRLEGITEACHLNAVHLDCGSMAREKKLRFSLDYDSRREIPDVMLRFVICSAGAQPSARLIPRPLPSGRRKHGTAGI